MLRVTTEPPVEPGIEVAWNTPDCDGCDRPEGELRDFLIRAIQSARATLDLSVYGIDDPALVEALCNAAGDGVEVRLTTDETSENPRDSRSYFPSVFSPDTGLAGCGVDVQAVRSYGLMHHKFALVDRGLPSEAVLTGSTNWTVAGLTENHNNSILIRGVPELTKAYGDEFDQLYRHCATERLSERASCDECSPACVEDRSEEGPWDAPDGGSVAVYFSPSDDAMAALRGSARSVRMDAPDTACAGPDADCVCRMSGTQWVCDYCAEGDDGYGLVGEAASRIRMSMYSETDACFALGVAKARRRGVSVRTVWDFVRSGSVYSRDDYLCAEGVETWISAWGNGSAQVRNHDKIIVVDDAVFTGSMNLGDSGAEENDENSLLLRHAPTADLYADHVDSEIALLETLGVTTRRPDECVCSDLVDNDGDGLADAADPDCDAGR